MSEQKQQWGTRVGVILAVAGSAVGLGNFLRFPVRRRRTAAAPS
jgi:NSS family neurotransmitter:Na+ symporter